MPIVHKWIAVEFLGQHDPLTDSKIGLLFTVWWNLETATRHQRNHRRIPLIWVTLSRYGAGHLQRELSCY